MDWDVWLGICCFHCHFLGDIGGSLEDFYLNLENTNEESNSIHKTAAVALSLVIALSPSTSPGPRLKSIYLAPDRRK